jgi:hypothetical protein
MAVINFFKFILKVKNELNLVEWKKNINFVSIVFSKSKNEHTIRNNSFTGK